MALAAGLVGGAQAGLVRGDRAEWIGVADSVEDYQAGTQGANGWWYLWSESVHGSRQEMIFEDCDPFEVEAWRSCCGSYCIQTADEAHTNTFFHCSGWIHGCQYPVRRWVVPQDGRFRLNAHFSHWLDEVPGVIDGVEVTLKVNDLAIWTSRSNPVDGSCAHDDWMDHDMTLAAGDVVDLVSSARLGCHSDRHQIAMWFDGIDCNGDGTLDNEQIATGDLMDADGNWIPDCCEAGDPCDSCTGDVVPDGMINASDLAAVVAGYGTVNAWLDVDGSGVVDTGDILQVCDRWGPCP